MPYRRLAEDVLARWRAIEMQLAKLDPMSPEADELKLDSYRLRQQYQDLIAQATAQHRPQPPPFPDHDLDDELGGPDRSVRTSP